jgi:GTPase SAR1 family protein
MAAPYFQGVAGAVLCFDLSNRDSFEHIKRVTKAFKILRNQFTGHPILVGCKSDLKHQLQVTLQEAKVKSETKANEQEFAFLNGMVYFETSSKTGECVNEALTFLGKQILEKQRFVRFVFP